MAVRSRSEEYSQSLAQTPTGQSYVHDCGEQHDSRPEHGSAQNACTIASYESIDASLRVVLHMPSFFLHSAGPVVRPTGRRNFPYQPSFDFRAAFERPPMARSSIWFLAMFSIASTILISP